MIKSMPFSAPWRKQPSRLNPNRCTNRRDSMLSSRTRTVHRRAVQASNTYEKAVFKNTRWHHRCPFEAMVNSMSLPV